MLLSALIAAGVGLQALLFCLPYEIAIGLVNEGGVVELAQVVVWASAAGLAAIGLLRGRLPHGLPLLVLTTLCALRELDFHKRFSPVSITSTRFYKGGYGIPIPVRIAVGLLLIVCAVILVRGLLRAWPELRAGLANRATAVVSGLAGMATLVGALIIDKLIGVLERSGFLTYEQGLTSPLFEEPLELVGAALVLIAIWLALRHEQRGMNYATEPSLP